MITEHQFKSLPEIVRKAAADALVMVAGEIHQRAIAKRPKMRDYEIHHEYEVARGAILSRLAAEPSGNINDYLLAARKSVSLPTL